MQPDVGKSSGSSVLTKPILGVPDSPSESSIFRVHKKLREVNERAYEPDIVSIGPYHHGKPSLQMMEVQKKVYLQLFLKGRNEDDAGRYIRALEPLEKVVRSRYAEYISLDPGKFVEMMLYDGFFIIEVILRFGGQTMIAVTNDPSTHVENDPIFKMQWMVNSLQRDLILFENQLPYFLLNVIIEIISPPTEIVSHDGFLRDALIFFSYLLPTAGDDSSTIEIQYERALRLDFSTSIYHLLELVHESCFKPLAGQSRLDKLPSRHDSELQRHDSVVQSRHDSELQRHDSVVQNRHYIQLHSEHGSGRVQERVNRGVIQSTTELQEAGVKLKAVKRSLFDIKFEGGVMEVPSLTIEDRTEALFRNLVAYEQYRPANEPSAVSDYVRFLDCLVDTPKDVQILSRLGIIDNWLGDDGVVSTMFNTISEAVVAPTNTFQYEGIFARVNEHCSRKRNKWMATFKRDYFNGPWAGISVLAALALLVLTLTQTVFTVFPRK